MRSAKKTLTVFLCFAFCIFSEIHAQNNKIIGLKNHRELFVDNYLIDKLSNASLRLHKPRNEGSVMKFDKPWEGGFSGYCTIIKDGDLYRAYYRGRPLAGADGSEIESTCYAESKDGIHWTKPDLGINKIAGTSSNNTILVNEVPMTHNFSPFLDKNPEREA